MKKILSVLLLGAMMLATLASCGDGEGSTTTTAAAGTTTPAATTTAAPEGDSTTTAGEDEGEDPDDDRYVPETPMADADVLKFMEDNASKYLNDKIDMDQVQSPTTGFFLDGGVKNMFDSVYTADEWAAATEQGLFDAATVLGEDGNTYINLGKTGWGGSTGAIYWGMTEKVKLGTYVIYTGNDNATYQGRLAVEWRIMATNEAPDPANLMADPDAMIDAGWVELDYVYDGAMADADFTPFGYSIDADKQGEYQYYCWLITDGGYYVKPDTGERVSSGLIQTTGMKLYAA